MKRFFSTALLVVGLLVVAHAAQASISVTLYNYNANTLLMVSAGSINTNGLSGFVGANWYEPSIKPSNASFATGVLPRGTANNSTAYKLESGPTSFVGGNSTIAPPGSHAPLNKSYGVINDNGNPQTMYFVVPLEYQSGQSLDSKVYMRNCTIESLNLRNGNPPYQWRLSNGETITLALGQQKDLVPEPTTVLIWSMLAGLGMTVRRRR